MVDEQPGPLRKTDSSSNQHPLTGARITAAITILAFSSIGLTLMGYALDDRKFLFWLGLLIAWVAAPLTIWLFWKEFRHWSLWSVMVVAAVAAELLVPCSLFFVHPSGINAAVDTDPRDKLAKMGVPYSYKGFEDALIGGQLDVLNTFFQAGYSPNRISSTDMFSSTLAMKNNDSSFPEVLALMKAHGIDFHLINHASALMKSWPLNRPLNQEEELFYVASISAGSDDKIKTLVREGADPTSLVIGLTQRMKESPSQYLAEIAVPLKKGLAGTKYAQP